MATKSLLTKHVRTIVESMARYDEPGHGRYDSLHIYEEWSLSGSSRTLRGCYRWTERGHSGYAYPRQQSFMILSVTADFTDPDRQEEANLLFEAREKAVRELYATERAAVLAARAGVTRQENQAQRERILRAYGPVCGQRELDRLGVA